MRKRYLIFASVAAIISAAWAAGDKATTTENKELEDREEGISAQAAIVVSEKQKYGDSTA